MSDRPGTADVEPDAERTPEGAPVDGAPPGEAPVDGTGSDAPATGPASTGGTRLPWVIAGIAAVAAIVFGILWALEVTDDQDLDAIEEAAGRFALTLTSWDASDGMGDTREQLRDASTERFASEVDELFGGTDDLAELEEVGARSSAEVEDVLVQRVDGDSAEVLAVIVQRVTTEITDGEEVSLRYARLGMVETDQGWRVDQVELLVDLLQQSAERQPDAQAPGGDLDLDDLDDLDLPDQPEDDG